MFLKSLTMKGFKSFADPTVLEFEPGITVVVGPNGSGKSNVVDAVTWVMGAQGPRALRSAKMEDVIFAGTSMRPPLGRAEVSLTIDNSSGKLPLDMAEVTISRILFRSGDSEYSINGAPCRLLDIQELLSDTGVGRHQHMIIGQGQLDTVLNARPEDRRAIVEDAAGVRKHRRRKERAERRLDATQENLERLGDLVREVRRQIRPLERQAAAARSHAALAEEWMTLRRFVAGRELVDLAERRVRSADGLRGLAEEAAELEAGLARLDEATTNTMAEMSSRREEDLATALGRVQGLVERTRGTTAVLKERARSLAASLDAAADVDVVSTLEAEGARLTAELGDVESSADALATQRAEVEVAEAELAEAERQHLAAWGDGAELVELEEALGAARVRQELLARSVAQAERVRSTAEQRIAALGQRAGALEATGAALELRRGELEALGQQRRLEVGAVESRALVASQQAEQAAAASQRAEEQRHRSAARAEALARAFHELRGSGGRHLLDGISGVVGSLAELVEIDEGWEAAFEAAAGASIAAVVVDGRTAAREALDRLRRGGATGALLAAAVDGAVSRWTPTPDSLPSGATPVRPHVRARVGMSGVDQVLDQMIGAAVRVEGWELAIDLALERPDLVVVTGEGDRFARTGWHVSSPDGVVTGAAVERAAAQAEAAAAAADLALRQLDGARSASERARDEALAAARLLERHATDTRTLEAEQGRLREDRERVSSELGDARLAHEESQGRLAEDSTALDAAESAIARLAGQSEVAAQRAEQAAAAHQVLDARRSEVAADRRRVEMAVAGLGERRRVLADRLAEIERRLVGHADERAEAADRRHRLEAAQRAHERLAEVVATIQRRLQGLLEGLRHDYQNQQAAVRAGGERLETLRRDRSAVERRLGQVRERARSFDLESAEVSLRAEALEENVRRELGSEPEVVMAMEPPELDEGTDAASRVATLGEALGALGPINPLALEELSVLEERHRELDAQVDDVRNARRELQEVVRTLDRQIEETFAEAVADVNEHFSSLVSMLFPGGTGRLTLTEPEDLLNTGIEIEVRPAGRNVRRVSLLSGGERSLSALAFLFAVFRSRPTPFYLMDEVEAALDDVNLHRFLGLVDEFRTEAQLIIVSHQKRTMEAANALYGVTMAPGGSSQVVSQKVERESQRAAS
jgi:chromosome segregation protein